MVLPAFINVHIHAYYCVKMVLSILQCWSNPVSDFVNPCPILDVCTCMKPNSLQLSVLLTEGMEVIARRDRSPRLMIPKETYISTLQTSSSFHAFSTLAWTCQHIGCSRWNSPQSSSFMFCFMHGHKQLLYCYVIFQGINEPVDAHSPIHTHTHPCSDAYHTVQGAWQPGVIWGTVSKWHKVTLTCQKGKGWGSNHQPLGKWMAQSTCVRREDGYQSVAVCSAHSGQL